MSTVLISSIDRSTTYPIYQSVSIPNNQMFLTINTSTWTEQMFYELPNIQFGIYTKVNGEYVKYLSENITVKTKVPESSTSPADAICYKIINIPNEFYLYIKPIFDNNAIEAHNALIENGIEDGTIWTTPTDTFNIEIGYNIGDYVPVTNTITAVPPISFRSDGTPLISWSIKGNGQQTGTPTSDNPVMPTFCGVRTANLLNLNRSQSTDFTLDTSKWMIGAVTTNNVTTNALVTINGSEVEVTSYTAGYGASFIINAKPNTQYAISVKTDKTPSGTYFAVSSRDENSNVLGSPPSILSPQTVYRTETGTAFLNICLRFGPSHGKVTYSDIMVAESSTALPYEPFGWAEKITCAGQTVPVYLGQTQTVRRIKKLVLTGEEANWIILNGLFNIQNFLNSSPFIAGYQAYCSHAVYNPVQSGLANVMQNGEFALQRASTAYNVFFKNDSYSTVSDFKSYLAAQYANGTPVTVWYVLATPQTGIVNEPLAKIGDYADELHSEDAAVTIPTVSGSNTLTVETDLQPSEVSITGTITQI